MANTVIIDLEKPAGTDHALISVLNSNSDKIDAEAGRQRGNFAGTYSSTSGYAVGDYCIYQGNLYRCTTAIGSSGENWTAGHWTSAKVGTELKGLSDHIANIGTMVYEVGNNVSIASGEDKQLTSVTLTQGCWLLLGFVSLNIGSAVSLRPTLNGASTFAQTGPVSVSNGGWAEVVAFVNVTTASKEVSLYQYGYTAGTAYRYYLYGIKL